MANQDYYRFVSELNANGAGDAHGGEEDDAQQGACNDKEHHQTAIVVVRDRYRQVDLNGKNPKTTRD